MVGLTVEGLESRVLLSSGVRAVPELSWEEVKSAAAVGGSSVRLDLVVLHEIGHALGLGHTSNSASIMYSYYNPNYNLNNFSSDPAAVTLRSLYNNVGTSPWKDSLDPSPGNGRVDITWSYMPNGTALDKGSNSLFSALDSQLGRSTWQNVISSDLSRWASVSNGKISFVSRSDSGLPMNFSGTAQNDSRAGDIRFGAHRFDGPGKVLAHTYYPPPTNTGTAAGDLHLDAAEKWTVGASAPLAAPARTTSGSGATPSIGLAQTVFSAAPIDGVL